MSFKLLSYNVNFAAARGDTIGVSEQAVLAAIGEADADVIVLQETTQGWEDVFAQAAIPHTYKHRFFHDESSQSSGGISVFSKMPFDRVEVLHPRERVDGSWFPIFVADFHVNDSEIVTIACVHLRPPVYEAGRATPLSMAYTSPIRLSELEMLAAALNRRNANYVDAGNDDFFNDDDDGDNGARNDNNTVWTRFESVCRSSSVIIAGDFNENSNHLACSELHRRGLHDAVSDHGIAHTHWWPLRRVPLTSNTYLALRNRLDHVFHSARLLATRCRTLDNYEGNASDHLPIVVEFRAATSVEQQRRVSSTSSWSMGMRLGTVHVQRGSIWSD